MLLACQYCSYPVRTVQGQKAAETLTGAVLRVMLARAEEDDGDPGTARDAGGPAGAIVELLQTAPHSVPYAMRVGMFRQLLSMDKVRRNVLRTRITACLAADHRDTERMRARRCKEGVQYRRATRGWWGKGAQV